MLMEPVEREDGFFRYENGNLVRQRGYYIYYEKNPQMQAYMIDKNPDEHTENTGETGDDTVKNIRKIIKGKKKEEEQEQTEEKPSVFSYAATAALAAAVFAVGVNFYQDYRTAKQDSEGTAQVSSVIATPLPTSAPAVTPLPTSVPAATPLPTQKPLETPAEEKKESQTTASEISTEQQTDSASLYREESDTRKAKRREALEKKEKTDISENNDLISEETSETSGNTKESYVIRPGDTLYQISVARYGSTEAIEEICRLNGLSEQEIIYPGQIIVLP